MSYTNGRNFEPTVVRSKLADRGWRFRNSWWIFVPALSCGLLNFVGFFVAAIRTGKKKFWVGTALHAGILAAAIALSAISGQEKTGLKGALGSVGAIVFLAAIFAPIVHAAILNREYLRTLAEQEPWYGAPGPVPPPTPPAFMGMRSSDYFAQPDPRSGGAGAENRPGHLGSATSPAPVPPQPAQAWESPGTSSHQQSPAAPHSLDINEASASELVGQLQIDQALAERVVMVRGARGPFRNLDDLATAAGLLPHQLVRFRHRVTFKAPTTARDARSGPSGRVLDY